MLIKKANFIKEYLLNKGISLLISIIVALLVVVMFELLANRPKEIATIDITTITQNFIEQLKSQKLSHEELKDQITSFGTQLQEVIQKFADDNQIIVLPKEAVIAGTQDYTPYILTNLKERMWQA
jgi:hypothetical protein